MVVWRPVSGLLLVLILGLPATQAFSAESLTATLRQAQGLLQSRAAQQAFDLLAPLEDEYAGSRQYDYLLGLAALESGKVAIAILALQRALAVDPVFAGARMELARAYYLTGEHDHALREFDILQTQNPPAAMHSAIERYRQRIAAERQRSSSHLRAYVETRVGYDSNVNSATEDERFLGFYLTEESREVASPFLDMRSGLSWFLPAGSSTRFLAQLNIKRQVNSEASFVNTSALDGGLVMVQAVGAHNFSIGLNGSRLHVAGKENSEVGGVSAQWHQALSSSFALNLDSRLNRIRYAPESRVRNVDQVVTGLSLMYAAGADSASLFGLHIFSANEFQAGETSPYERQFAGARISYRQRISASAQLSTGLGRSSSEYQGPFFGSTREDNQFDVFVTLNWAPYKQWVFSSSVFYISNESEVPLYQYDKANIAFGVRWNFLD